MRAPLFRILSRVKSVFSKPKERYHLNPKKLEATVNKSLLNGEKAYLNNQTKFFKVDHINLISAFLGWLGAADLLFIGLYILTVYNTFSSIPHMERLTLQVYAATFFMSASIIALAYGSYLVWKSNRLKGGVINLLAGTLAPIPTYVNFTFLSEPSLLGWLGPLGGFLLVPAVISGTISIAMYAWTDAQ